jgi:16S rRNA (cytidine1402-2'-O)-methyltransferase
VKPDERLSRIRYYEKRSETEHQTQIFIEAPYRNNQLWESFVSALKPSTRLCIAVNLTLEQEKIVSMNVGEWKKQNRPELHKQPAVFIIQAG